MVHIYSNLMARDEFKNLGFAEGMDKAATTAVAVAEKKETAAEKPRKGELRW